MKKLVVPREIFHQHVAILGKTRSGKSSVARLLVEDLLGRGEPVCIIDPKGDWWGIKLSADGKGPGFPVVIFGGEHADVPINAHAGKSIGELVATGNRPCLIDLGGWTVGDRTKFWIDFASTLFRAVKGTHHLVIDEFHNFAPKGKILDPNAGQALHWANRIASEGLGKGIPMIFASQRPQKVHNDALTSAETLIAMRVLHPADRGAVSDWIKGAGDASGAEVLDSLAQLPRGEGWVWSPEIKFGPERVLFPMFATYDSFRPQTAADTKKLKGWAEVDLDEVRATLATVVEQEKANDPRELRAVIAALRAELNAKNKTLGQIDVQTQRSDAKLDTNVAATQKRIAQLEESLKKLRATKIEMADRVFKALHAHAEAQAHRWAAQVTKAEEWLTRLRAIAVPVAPPAATRLAPLTPPKAVGGSRPSPPAARPARGGAESNGLKGMHRAMLTALAQHPDGLSKKKILIHTGYASSGPVSSAFADLVAHGYVEAIGTAALRITDAGVAALGHYEPLPTGDALREWLLTGDKLSGMEKKLLAAIADAYPKDIRKAEVLEATGYASSGPVSSAFGKLVGLGYVHARGASVVRATDELFD